MRLLLRTQTLNNFQHQYCDVLLLDVGKFAKVAGQIFVNSSMYSLFAFLVAEKVFFLLCHDDF